MVYQFNQNMNILGSLSGMADGGFGLGGCSSFGGWSGACGSIFNMVGGMFNTGTNIYGGGCGTGNIFYNCKTGNYNFGAIAGFSVGNSLLQVLGTALGYHFTSKRAEKAEAKAAEAKEKSANETLQKKLKDIDEKIDTQQAILDNPEKSVSNATLTTKYNALPSDLEGFTKPEKGEKWEGNRPEKATDTQWKAITDYNSAVDDYNEAINTAKENATKEIAKLKIQRAEVQEEIEDSIQAQLDKTRRMADADYSSLFTTNGNLADNAKGNISASALSTAYGKFNNATDDKEKRKFAKQFKAIYNELNNTSSMDITKTLSNANNNVDNWLKRNPEATTEA